MAVTFEQIEPKLRRLRDFVLDDLQRIVDQPVGGNYAAVAVVLCAYDAIGNLEGAGKGEISFAESLPGEWKPAASTLYNALGTGLIHTYETKSIRVAGREIELVLSWRDRAHLTFDGDQLFLKFESLDQAREVIGNYVTHYHHRPHSRLNYRTPLEVAATRNDGGQTHLIPAA